MNAMSPEEADRLYAEIARAVRAGLPQPAPGFEHRLVAAIHGPAPAPRRQAGFRLAAAISVALSILVVAGLLWVSPGFRGRLQAAGHEPVPAGQPASSARLAATPPPGGVKRFAYQTVVTGQAAMAGDPRPLIPSGPLRWADWSGAALPASPVPNGSFLNMVSPDGRYFTALTGPTVVTRVTGPNSVDVHSTPGTMRVVDESGAVVATASAGGGFDLWADDSKHLCGLDRDTRGWPSAILIDAVVPGRGLVRSRVPISGLPARSGGYMAGRSVTSDRAVLLPMLAGASMYGIQLSTGRVVFTRGIPAGATRLVISSDQRYAATTVPDATRGQLSTEVMDLETGAVVARLAGSAVGFSGDHQLVALNAAPNGGPASLVEWRTGRTEWQSDSIATIDSAQGLRWLPDSRAVALTLTNPDAAPDVVLVASDGTAKVVARGAQVETLGLVGAAG
jgi:hypothetical protein